MRHVLFLTALALPITPLPGLADASVILGATAVQSGATHTISVTLRHGDTGWAHYADGWSVQLPDGTELGYRTLHHPHVEEQPFTRSLGGVNVPEGTKRLVLVPHDSVHGWGDPFEITLGN